MIKIGKDTIDLVLQTEEDTSVQTLINRLTIDTGDVLVICPELFFQRFIQFVSDSLDEYVFDEVERQLVKSNGYVYLELNYKRKLFFFHFIVTSSETKTVYNPIKGEQIFNIGFKEIII